MDALNIVALCLLVFLAISLVYVVIYIHDIPYEIAKKRNHPHQDAIQVAGYISLVLMHTIWPFLWIWAYLYKPDNTSLIKNENEVGKLADEIDRLRADVEQLKKK